MSNVNKVEDTKSVDSTNGNVVDTKGINGTKEFKDKFKLTNEEINLLGRIDVVLTKTKYGSCVLSFDLIPNLQHTERISNLNYFIALSDNGQSTSLNSVKYRVPHRFVKGIRQDGNGDWYGVEFFISKNYRPRFFIGDREMLALKIAKKELAFQQVVFNDKDFGVEEVVI